MTFVTQPSFTAGELAPSLRARVDIAKYQVGAEVLYNMFPHVHGGISNRAGTYYIDEVEDSSKAHRLIPFTYSPTQAYALVFGDSILRFVTEASGVFGYITLDLVESGTYKWTASGSGTDEYYMELNAGGDPAIMQAFNVYEDSSEMTEGTVGSLAVGEWDWGDNDSLGYNTVYVRLTDGADPDSKADGFLYLIIEVVSPYPSADLAELTYTQSADVIYLFHPDYESYKLSRLSNTSWTLVASAFVDGPWKAREYGDSDIIVTPAARTGNDVAITSNADLFAAKHVGSLMRVGYMNPLDATDIKWGYGTIDQVTDAQTARMDITKPLGYEQVFNSDFKLGLIGWEDKSGSDSTLAFTDSGPAITLTKGATTIADVRQELELVIGEKVTLSITIDSIAGTLRVLVGTTTGASDISGPTSYTTTGTKTIDFTPNQAEVHITFDDTGSSTGEDCQISEISVMRSDKSTSDWRLAPFNDTDGYPRVGGFFDQRLIMAGTLAMPLTTWASVVGRFNEFAFNSPLEDSDGFSFRLDSGMVFNPQWVASLNSLLIGTTGAIYRVQGENFEALSVSSVDADAIVYTGCARISPVLIGNTIVYVQWGSNKVNDLTFKEVEGYLSSDLSILSNHLFDGYTISEWAYASLPEPIIWAVRDDGLLLGLTYNKEHDVQGWSRHETDGTFESVCTLPGVGYDRVYTIVNRTINGATKRYIEVSMPRINNADTYDYFFVDCGLTYSGAAATSITGLDHLEGEEVVVLADGNVVEGLIVTSGAITLPVAATLVHVGLSYYSDFGSLGVSIQDQMGSAEGRTKTIPSVDIRFENTRAAFVGPDATRLDEMRFRDDYMGEDPIPLYTGIKSITLNTGYDREGKIYVRNTSPTPITILSITPEVHTSEN